MDVLRAGDAAIPEERAGRGPWAPWAFALSALAHGALLGLLIATAETPATPVPEAFSIDLVPGSGVEAAGDAGGGPDGHGESDAEPPPAAAAAEPAPDPEPQRVEAVPPPDPSPPDGPDSVAPVPARKPTVKPVTAATTRASSPAIPAPATPAKDMARNRDGAAAATGPAAGPAMGSGMNGSAVADAGVGSGGADAMRVYLEEVRRRLQVRLAVPAEARRLRLGGTVLVRFTVRGDGSVPGESMAVLSGPGVAVLERAALETVARTAPFPPPPKPATVEVPVLFAVSVR